MSSLINDIRYGIRSLLKRPAFALVVILALALGIGANTAIFSLVNGILLRPLPFTQPDQLVIIYSRRPDSGKHPFNLPDFIDYRDQNRTMSAIAAYSSWSANLTSNGEPERLQAIRISANAFELLGVRPAVGRTLLSPDDSPPQRQVVVLSYGLWQRRFNGDPQLIGKSLTLNDSSYTVVGVLPPEFFFPIKEAELAVPLAPDADPSRGVRTSTNSLRALGRLKTGVTREQAEADLSAVAQRAREQYPVANVQKIGVSLSPWREEIVGNFRLALMVLLAAVGAVLLITCVNLASLALARASARHKEMAVRTALGATRRRLIQQLTIESLILAVIGGGVGVLLAIFATDLLLTFRPADLPRAAEIGIDTWVLGFTFTISVLAGLICGLIPAWQVSRVELNEELKESGRGSSGSRRQNRARNLLVVSEIALSLVLLIVAGLLIKSFSRLQEVNPGFTADHVLAVRLSLPKALYSNRAALTAFYEQLKMRLEDLPGVEKVGFISALPLSGTLHSIPFTIEGRAHAPDQSQRADYRIANSSYFQALKIPLIAGREFNDHDTAQTIPVAIISQSLARRNWPNGSPVGARLLLDDNDQGPRTVEIAGVVGDVKHLSLDGEAAPTIYLPISQVPEDGVVWLTSNQYWLLRTSNEPSALSTLAQREIQTVDREVPTTDIRTMDQYLSASVAPRRFNLWLLMVFAGAALILATTGLYGLISFGVAQRRREFGIRLALGAQANDVLKLVVRQGVVLAIAGVTVGSIVALLLTRLMQSLLFGVSASDPVTFIVVALLLTLVGLLACYIPARRATKVDPLVALRYE